MNGSWNVPRPSRLRSRRLLHPAFGRAGPDEGQRLGQLVDVVRFHPAEQVHHRRAFDLEAADRFRLLEQAERLRVARRDGRDPKPRHRLGDGRQPPDRQQVELDELQVLDGVAVVVGHGEALGRRLERQIPVRGRGREDDAADVERNLVVDAAEFAGQLPDVEIAGRGRRFLQIARARQNRAPACSGPAIPRAAGRRPGPSRRGPSGPGSS